MKSLFQKYFGKKRCKLRVYPNERIENENPLIRETTSETNLLPCL